MWNSTRILMAAACLAPMASANLISEPGIPGRIAFPPGTTIDVWIQPDPVGGGTRNVDIQAGIERWAPVLQPYGINLAFHSGTAPTDADGNPPQNAVQFNWENPANFDDPTDDGESRPIPQTTTDGAGNETIDHNAGGVSDISNNVAGSAYIENLAMHEFGHDLGLAHDESPGGGTHNVMDHFVPTTGVMQFSLSDIAEVATMFGQVFANVTTMVTDLTNGIYQYQYNITWTGGADIPLVEIGTNGANIFNVMGGNYALAGTSGNNPTPDGWFWFDPRNAASAAGYMDDVRWTAPADGSLPYLIFDTETAQLNAGNPSYRFSFDSTSAPGTVLAYTSGAGTFSVVGPRGAPEPGTWAMIGLGLVGLGIVRRVRGAATSRYR